MNLGLILCGLLFMVNPEIMIIDLIPDFIGFLLIAKGLSKVSRISPSAEASRKGFQKLAAVSAIKLVSVLPMFSLSSTDKAFSLLFVTAFMIIEFIYLFPAFGNLFSSISFFSDRFNTPKAVKNLNFFKISTLVFLIIKRVAAFLPETVYLYITEENLYDTVTYPLEHYKTGFMSLCAAVSLVIGLVWGIIAIYYFTRLKNNRHLVESINKETALISADRPREIISSTKRALTTLWIASLFFIGLNLDGVPILPFAVAAALMFFGVFNLRKITEIKKSYYIILAAVFTVSMMSFASTRTFAAKYYDYVAAAFSKSATDKFIVPVVFEFASAVSIIAALFVIRRILLKIIEDHTGYYLSGNFVNYNSKEAKKNKNLIFRLNIGTALGAALCISDALSYALMHIIPKYRAINVTPGVIFAVFIYLLYSSIISSVKSRYENL